MPPPVVACPCNLGVEVLTRLAPYDHSDQQRCKGSFDGVKRAQHHVEWFALKGDLIPADVPTKKTANLVRKFSPGGSKAGRVSIIISTVDDSQHFSPDDGEFHVFLSQSTCRLPRIPFSFV